MCGAFVTEKASSVRCAEAPAERLRVKPIRFIVALRYFGGAAGFFIQMAATMVHGFGNAAAQQRAPPGNTSGGRCSSARSTFLSVSWGASGSKWRMMPPAANCFAGRTNAMGGPMSDYGNTENVVRRRSIFPTVRLRRPGGLRGWRSLIRVEHDGIDVRVAVHRFPNPQSAGAIIFMTTGDFGRIVRLMGWIVYFGEDILCKLDHKPDDGEIRSYFRQWWARLPRPKSRPAPDHLGWRHWRWESGRKLLVSPAYPAIWIDGELRCDRPIDMTTPEPDGEYGIHAYLLPRYPKLIAGDWRNDGGSQTIWGVVERLGDSVVGEKGWRAEWVIIRELHVPPTVIEDVSAAYPHIPMYETPRLLPTLSPSFLEGD